MSSYFYGRLGRRGRPIFFPGRLKYHAERKREREKKKRIQARVDKKREKGNRVVFLFLVVWDTDILAAANDKQTKENCLIKQKCLLRNAHATTLHFTKLGARFLATASLISFYIIFLDKKYGIIRHSYSFVPHLFFGTND